MAIWSRKLLGLGLIGMAAATATTRLAQADELPAWLTERRIIGQNDLEPIENTRSTDVYDKANIVARVETASGQGFCTASRVGENLFLTNFHCFEFVGCDDLRFHLGYERDKQEHDQILYKCTEVLAKNETFDYALYRAEFVGAVAAPGDTQTHAFPGLGLDIPDDDADGVKKTFAIDQDGDLTNLKIHVKIDHTWVGDLKISLTSPAGTTAVIYEGAGGSGSGLDTTFTLNDGLRAFVGEAARGDWVLQVVDGAADDQGTLLDVDFILTTATAPVNESVPDVRPEDYPIATLWDGPVAVDQKLLVASHPAARVKEIDRSDTCKLRTIEPEEVSGRQTITHTCDTEGGSSGSPVLDRSTGYVVALHWGGTNEYNLSIPMSLVLKDIRANVSTDVMAEMSIEQ